MGLESVLKSTKKSAEYANVLLFGDRVSLVAKGLLIASFYEPFEFGFQNVVLGLWAASMLAPHQVVIIH